MNDKNLNDIVSDLEELYSAFDKTQNIDDLMNLTLGLLTKYKLRISHQTEVKNIQESLQESLNSGVAFLYDGITYISHPENNNTCVNCGLYQNNRGCRESRDFYDCFENQIIWKKR